MFSPHIPHHAAGQISPQRKPVLFQFNCFSSLKKLKCTSNLTVLQKSRLLPLEWNWLKAVNKKSTRKLGAVVSTVVLYTAPPTLRNSLMRSPPSRVMGFPLSLENIPVQTLSPAMAYCCPRGSSDFTCDLSICSTLLLNALFFPHTGGTFLGTLSRVTLHNTQQCKTAGTITDTLDVVRDSA